MTFLITDKFTMFGRKLWSCTFGSQRKISIDLSHFGISKAYETDMLENINCSISVMGKKITITLKPYEIKSLKLVK